MPYFVEYFLPTFTHHWTQSYRISRESQVIFTEVVGFIEIFGFFEGLKKLMLPDRLLWQRVK
jgi:hypothetical protein